MPEVRLWCRVNIVGPARSVLAQVDVDGPGRPDLAAVERVARLALAAHRFGALVCLSDVCPEMAELLELVALPVEVQR